MIDFKGVVLFLLILSGGLSTAAMANETGGIRCESCSLIDKDLERAKTIYQAETFDRKSAMSILDRVSLHLKRLALDRTVRDDAKIRRYIMANMILGDIDGLRVLIDEPFMNLYFKVAYVNGKYQPNNFFDNYLDVLVIEPRIFNFSGGPSNQELIRQFRATFFESASRHRKN